MHAHIVLAHPESGSFNGHLAGLAEDCLKKKGWQVSVTDLYQQGFDPKRDIHQAVGGGLRFFIRSIAVPLIGFDAGFGLESRSWRFTLIVGA